MRDETSGGRDVRNIPCLSTRIDLQLLRDSQGSRTESLGISKVSLGISRDLKGSHGTFRNAERPLLDLY